MLVEALFQQASQQGGEIAIRDDVGEHTYTRVAAMASALGRHINSKTGKPAVGIMLPSGVGFVASFYGTLLAGKSVVPINFLLGDRELAHVIGDSGIDTVITAPPLAARLEGKGLHLIDLQALAKSFSGMLAIKAAEWMKPAIPQVSPNDMAVLMYTSGTSGLPKGVVLTYGNLQSDVDASIEHAQLQHKHVFLGVIPLFHAFGMTAMMIAPIQLGASIIYMARFNATAAVKAVKDHKVSLLFAVPSMLNAIIHLKGPAAEDFASIYALISGGEPLPVTLREAFLQRFGVPVYEGYGLTETSPVISLNTPQRNRPGSVGLPLPNVNVKIAEDGEVWLKGPMIMREYYQLPDETAAALTADGFFKTGDLGRLDDDGFLYITGRKKDLIIVAGEKALPREIEDILLQHPAVAEAAVVGKKDAGRGEVVVAFVTARPGQSVDVQGLREFCREKALPQWKIPREIFVESEMPHSPTGKILKRVLGERVNTPVA